MHTIRFAAVEMTLNITRCH